MRMQQFKCVVAVRPYGERMRGRVFAQLRAAGLHVGSDDVIADGTSDGDVIARLRERAGCVLLIPYHAHHDVNGGSELTGLDLAQRITRELPALRDVPILMPVSVYAAPAVWLR